MNTILLVDDEPEVLKLLERLLVHLGFRVLTAEDGIGALDVLARHGDEIQLLVTDVEMPGLDGHELARRFAARRPGAGILMLSGYPDDRSDDPSQPPIQFLPKPFTSRQLSAAIQALMPPPPASS